MTLSILARKLNLSPAARNETVNSLEKRELVARSPDPADARKVIIRATGAGEAMQNASSQEFHESMVGLFARMSKTKREGLLAGLEAMIRLSGDAGTGATTRRGDDAPLAKRNSPQSRPQ